MKQLKESILDANFDANDIIIDEKLFEGFSNEKAFERTIMEAMNVNNQVIANTYKDVVQQAMDKWKNDLNEAIRDYGRVFYSDMHPSQLIRKELLVSNNNEMNKLREKVNFYNAQLEDLHDIDDIMKREFGSKWKSLNKQVRPTSKDVDGIEGYIINMDRGVWEKYEDQINNKNITTKNLKVWMEHNNVGFTFMMFEKK